MPTSASRRVPAEAANLRERTKGRLRQEKLTSLMRFKGDGRRTRKTENVTGRRSAPILLLRRRSCLAQYYAFGHFCGADTDNSLQRLRRKDRAKNVASDKRR